MKIPFVDLRTQYARIKHDLDARIQAVLDHGGFILGPEVAEFEAALAAFTGCRNAVAVASGTDALQISLMAAGIGAGDAVFVPSFTFPATAEVVLLIGAEPVLVDIDPKTFNIDPDDLRRAIAEVERSENLRPRAVIVVDLYGQPADYRALNEIAERRGLFLLADAAQSMGASVDGARVGSLAPVTATSFYPAKPLGCYGDGGAILTNDDSFAELARSIRVHGRGQGKYDIVRVGINSRLDTIQAAVLLAKLEVFADELAARDAVARRYSECLDGVVTTPLVAPGTASAWSQYSIQIEDRDGLARALAKRGIPTAIYYPRPMHQQPAYARFDRPGRLGVSEEVSARVLSLPMHPYLEPKRVDMICDAVKGALTSEVTPRREDAMG